MLSLGLSVPGRAQVIPPSVLPGLAPGAARAAVDIAEPPWRGVVRVQTEVGARCTGALVGPRLVLTAAHCLFGRATGLLVQPGSIHVLTAYRRGAYDGHARAVSVETGPGFALGRDGRMLPTSSPGEDWAVLTLDTPVGTPGRVLPLARGIPQAGTAAMLGGYEQDRAQILLADIACAVLGAVEAGGSILLRHSCAGTRGVSGAPLFVRDAEGRWAVAGVATLSRVGVSGGDAVPVAAIAAQSVALR